MSKTIAAVVTKMVSELENLQTDEERERAFAGARAVLGMTNEPYQPAVARAQSGVASPADEGTKLGVLSTAGADWIRRYSLKEDKIDEHLQINGDGKVTPVGESIGKGKREQTLNTYLLTGVAALLESGRPKFTDEAAREYCKSFGCYDPANHSMTLTYFDNWGRGSKKAGWELTAPGLKYAAALFKPKEQENK